MGWILRILIAVDQLGNAIAGGNPDSTISARVGYFSQKDHCPYKWYWKRLEWIIDLTFYPINGPNHCLHAFQQDKDEKFKRGNDLARALLSTITIVACLFLSIALRLAIFAIPSWGNHPDRHGETRT